jgi:competence protein ComEC
LFGYLAGVGVTTLVASAATTPIAAFHFQTIPTYGAVANLLAVPLTSFVIMPAGMIGLLLMPLGLDAPLFRLMAWGCEAMLWIARTVAALPGASLLVHQWPIGALVLASVGAVWVALWRQPWRWLGLAPCGVALALVALSEPPDLLIDPTLGMAAVRSSDGRVVLVEWQRDRMVRDTWLKHFAADEAEPPPQWNGGPERRVACDEAGCIVDLDGHRIALARRPEAAVEDCGRVGLVIARVGPETCRDGDMIGPRALRASGGLAVTGGAHGLQIRTVREWRGEWPWNRLITQKLK